MMAAGVRTVIAIVTDDGDGAGEEEGEAAGEVVESEVFRPCGCTPDCLDACASVVDRFKVRSMRQGEKRVLLHAVTSFSNKPPPPTAAEGKRKKTKKRDDEARAALGADDDADAAAGSAATAAAPRNSFNYA